MALGAWFGKIFGTGKALEQGLSTVDTVAKGTIAGMDALFYTAEEKSNDSIRVTKMRMDMVKGIQDEFAPRAITRRVLAIIIIASVFLHFQVMMLLACFSALWPRFREITDAAGKTVSVNVYQEAMSLAGIYLVEEVKIAMIVVFFYFGYYGVKSVIKARNNK